MPSNELIIEIDFFGEFEPFELKLSNVILGFKDFLRNRGSGWCQIDINCPEGTEWQKEKRSVAMIYFSGYICTGSLINNARNDCRDYFLTAHHCISKQSTAEKTVFYWDFEWSECGGGELYYSNYSQGANLRATNQRSDFTLLELAEKPPKEYNLFYSGWSIDETPSEGAVVIHHPFFNKSHKIIGQLYIFHGRKGKIHRQG